MIRKILRASGLYIYLRYWRQKHFPSDAQRVEKNRAPSRQRFYSQFLKSGDLCFDIGANIGDRTEVFLALNTKIVAVEPQKDCAKMLHLRFGKKIQLVPLALGEKEKMAQMYVSESSEISSLSEDWINAVSTSRFSNSRWNKNEMVKVTTLDKLIETFGLPKFCKIDVEGYEEQVLKGLSKPIDYISIEYTIPERLENLWNCLQELSRIGTFQCNYTIGENMKFELVGWVTKEKIFDELKQFGSQQLFGDIYVRFTTN